ncbi:MAG: hypothetical protein D5R96_01305 [Methanocalculus sp. MSAO_Arc2]|nr:MAG: hypothetical protein D5R96_01305 [Methanocalculus sp. MSAO_Arc2]
MNKTMDRRVRGKSLTPRQKRRNKAIIWVRGLVERSFAVINRVFHAATVMVTTVARTNVKNMFRCLNYNLFQSKPTRNAVMGTTSILNPSTSIVFCWCSVMIVPPGRLNFLQAMMSPAISRSIFRSCSS